MWKTEVFISLWTLDSEQVCHGQLSRLLPAQGHPTEGVNAVCLLNCTQDYVHTQWSGLTSLLLSDQDMDEACMRAQLLNRV